jgi:hypothetical protein
MIITEATPGNQPPAVYSTTATWRESIGQQKIYYFNPGDLHINFERLSLLKTAHLISNQV